MAASATIIPPRLKDEQKEDVPHPFWEKKRCTNWFLSVCIWTTFVGTLLVWGITMKWVEPATVHLHDLPRDVPIVLLSGPVETPKGRMAMVMIEGQKPKLRMVCTGTFEVRDTFIVVPHEDAHHFNDVALKPL